MNPISGCKGLTLLEMLVVLILTGMVTGILLQGLHQVFRLQQRFGIQQFDTQQGTMLADWFRQSINGLVPDHDDGKYKFRGSSRELAGLTLAPVSAATGALTLMTWRLHFDPHSGRTQLRFGAEENAPSVMEWPGNDGRFVYLDGQGESHDQWPPFLGKWPQIPAAVYLDAGQEEGGRVTVAIPKGPAVPLPRQRDLLNL